MKRMAVIVAAALGTGCVSESFSDVVIYWDFSRNLAISPFSVVYDANLSPGGAPLDRACAQSAVEYVVITDAAGNLYDPATPTIPCVYAGVQGATLQGFATGDYTFVVHGYRTVGGVPVEVHRGQGSVHVSGTTPLTITAAGVQAALDVNLSQGGAPFSCLTGDTLGYTLQDPVATTIDTRSGLACGNPIAFAGVDLDNLDIRVQVTNGGAVVLDSCVSQPFNHFGADVGTTFGWPLTLYSAAAPPTGVLWPCP